MRQDILRAIVTVAREKEFFGHIIQQFDKIFVSGNHPVRTAAVGKPAGERLVKLYINEDYFSKLREEGNEVKLESGKNQGDLWFQGVVEHEILHVVFNHLDVHRIYPNHLKANLAFDCVVNQEILKEKTHENWVYPADFNLPEGMDSKFYYDNITDAQCDKFKPLDFHDWWGNCDEKDREAIKDAIRKARQNTSKKSWGSMSDGMKELIDGLLEFKPTKVPWQKIFKTVVANSQETYAHYSLRKESKRFGTRPGIVNKERANVAVVIDTSGSIGTDEFKVFFNEIHWIWRSGVEITIIEADADVKRIYKYDGKMKPDIIGGGGTDLEPALKAVEYKYDMAIYLTDFCARQISRRYNIPVIWAINGSIEKENYPCDWGRVVKIGG